MKQLGQALFETGFTTGSFYPQTGGTVAGLPASVKVSFQPQALAFTHRYEATPEIRPADVKGYPSGTPHGGKFTTRAFLGGSFQDPELRDLMAKEAFLAAFPQFRDVLLDFDRDYLDLCFLDGAWAFLVQQDARFNPAVPGATGPTRQPEGGVVPAPPTAAPAPLTPVALPAVTAGQAAPVPLTPKQKLVEALEELNPGQPTKYGPLVELLVAGGKPSTLTIILAVAAAFE